MAAPTPVAKKKGTLSRYVLPIGLFVLVVGGIAWLTQYLPSWRAPASAVVDPDKRSGLAGKQVIQVVGSNVAVWERDADGNNTGYVREYERGVEGHYDFPFKNILGAAAELGLVQVSCDCTYAKICVLPGSEWEKVSEQLQKDPAADVTFTHPPTWQKVTAGDTGAKIPADAGGLIRITWNGRKNAGQDLRIYLRFWAQPEGDMGSRQFENFAVPVVMANPVQFDPYKQTVGILGPADVGKADFFLWSATRGPDELNVKVGAIGDPLLATEARPLSPEECRRLADRLKEKKIATKVRAGYQLTASVYESKGDKQMEQGPFLLTVPLLLDDIPSEFGGPQVVGAVKGDVEIGSLEDQGKIDLKSFPAREGTRRTITVYTKPDQQLEVQDHHPPALDVKLTKVGKDAVLNRTRWTLRVVVPPNAVSGTLGEQAIITLRVPGNPPRLIRVPVLGTATAGQG
jgi:hypothetical protein